MLKSRFTSDTSGKWRALQLQVCRRKKYADLHSGDNWLFEKKKVLAPRFTTNDSWRLGSIFRFKTYVTTLRLLVQTDRDVLIIMKPLLMNGIKRQMESIGFYVTIEHLAKT